MRRRGQRLGRLSDGPALFVATLRRLVDDGRLRTAVLAKDGRTLDLGRAHRAASGSQMLALWRRDRGCTVPGCGRIRFLHAHHVVFWSNGGHTNLDNLVLLCGEHHKALHDGAFTIRAVGHQTFAFHDSEGVQYQTAPSTSGTATELVAAHRAIDPETIAPHQDGRLINLGQTDGESAES